MQPWLVPPTGGPASAAAKVHAVLPRLETARLVLRPAQLGDYAVWDQIVMGPAGEFVGGPFDARGAYLDFAQCVVGWVLHGCGLWAIEDRADGAVLGFVAHGFEYGNADPQLGYLLIDAAQGKGIATEAASAVRDYAFDVLGQDTLVLYFHPQNAASRAVAVKLGAVQDSAAEAKAKGASVYRLFPSGGGMEAYA